MPVLAPRKVTFLAKAEYFTTPGIKGFFSRAFMSTVGMVPIDRENKDAAQAALDTGVRVLRSGRNNLLGIYPEGTRSPDGRLYRGKTGVARLALESGAVVIPWSWSTPRTIQPPGRRFPKLRPRPGVVVGKPLDFSRYEGMAGDRFVERSMTDEIMYELMQLSGQEYVDVYAADVKKALGRRFRLRQPRPAPTPASWVRAPRTPGPRRAFVRFFYDCEFIEDGHTIELVSIGVVDETGREFYAVSTEFDPSRAIDWVRKQRAGQAAQPVRSGLALAGADPRRPAGVPARAGGGDRAVGLDVGLRPRRALPALGRHAGVAAGDPALHPRAAAALGGRRLARRCRPHRPTSTTRSPTPATTSPAGRA